MRKLVLAISLCLITTHTQASNDCDYQAELASDIMHSIYDDVSYDAVSGLFDTFSDVITWDEFNYIYERAELLIKQNQSVGLTKIELIQSYQDEIRKLCKPNKITQ